MNFLISLFLLKIIHEKIKDILWNNSRLQRKPSKNKKGKIKENKEKERKNKNKIHFEKKQKYKKV